MATITPTLISAATLASTTDGTSFSTPSWTPTPNRVILLFIGYSVASGSGVDPTTLTGNGLTWVRQASGNGTLSGFAVFAAYTNWSPATGVTTATFGAVTQTSCLIHIVEIGGADMTGGLAVGGGGAVAQVLSTVADGISLTVTVPLPNAPNASSRCFSGWLIDSAVSANPRANWTELADNTVATPTECLETQWRSDAADQSGGVTYSSVKNVRGAVLEIRTGGCHKAVIQADPDMSVAL